MRQPEGGVTSMAQRVATSVDLVSGTGVTVRSPEAAAEVGEPD